MKSNRGGESNLPLTPSEALLEILGAANVLVPRSYKPGRATGRAAVNRFALYAVRKGLGFEAEERPVRIYTSWRGLSLAVPGDEITSDYRATPSGQDVPPEELAEAVPDYPARPHFVVDYRFWGEHSDFGRTNLIRQTAVTASTLRLYLSDHHMSLVNVTPEAEERFLKAFPSFEGGLYEDWEDLIAELSVDRVILLDPNAEEELDESEIREDTVFVLGGIVDENMRGWTAKLAPGIPCDVERRRITLGGSIVGVPDRINALVEALSRVIVDGESLERAILRVQSPRFARRRLNMELRRLGELTGEELRRLQEVVNLPKREILLEARRRGIELKVDLQDD
ncbi:hypothetical protein [Methanopyrus sp.]